MAPSPVLHVEHVTKSFPGQTVLRSVNLTLRRGEVYALTGHNGSGKSTLIKILAGFHRPDPGASAKMLGEPVDLYDPGGQWRQLLHFIHQDLALVGSLSAIENIALMGGYSAGRFGRIDWRRTRERVDDLIARFGVALDVTVPVERLAPAERTLVALARALDGCGDDGCGILVLDEPTATLSARDTDQLFAVIRSLCARGVAVLFVTHHLDEIMSLADRVGVLRDGAMVAEQTSADVTEESLAELIVGHAVERLDRTPGDPDGDVLLDVDQLAGIRLRDLSTSVRVGEILGIAGLLGSGREEVGPLIFGVDQPTAGVVSVGGIELTGGCPRQAIASGVGYVPADRKRLGFVADLTVAENMTLPMLRSISDRCGRISPGAERRVVGEWINSVHLAPPDPNTKLDRLSGGNQQKVVIAKALAPGPRVLVLEEPTQGVDIGAQVAIHRLIADAARGGRATVIVSDDLDELVALCDRVIVLHRGRMNLELARPDISADRIASAMLASAG